MIEKNNRGWTYAHAHQHYILEVMYSDDQTYRSSSSQFSVTICLVLLNPFFSSTVSLSLSPSHAHLYQVPSGPDRDFRRRGIISMPGGGGAQTSHHLDEDGEEGQLPALWGRTCCRPSAPVMCENEIEYSLATPVCWLGLFLAAVRWLLGGSAYYASDLFQTNTSFNERLSMLHTAGFILKPSRMFPVLFWKLLFP